MAQHHDAVGDLGHDREVVGDVVPAVPNSAMRSRRSASTSIWVVTSSAVVGSSSTIETSGPAAHRHGGHDALELPARHLMRVAAADRIGVRELQDAEELARE